jgi:aryl-alcohol dehydrogenase-like predicted oxidoreductase/enamine deaminase RidA (YjgF/YER057c/UK114 family)
MGKVETIELAPGLVISRVLSGLWQIADLERGGRLLDPESTALQMAPYVEAGFTSFDMADHYGSAELIAGCFGAQHLLGSRAQMLTKWVPEPGSLNREAVRAGVSRALERLQTEQLDLLQFHAWHYPDPSWLDALFWLDELREEGLIAQLGVTNFDAAHLRIALASGLPLVSNQVSYSLVDQRAAGPLASLCEEYDVKLLAYGTLAGGFLTENWLGAAEPLELATWSQMKFKRFIDAAGGWTGFQDVLASLAGIAEAHGVTVSTVASRFILDQPGVAGVILGARLGESDHVQENLAIFDLELSEEDREVIASGIEALDPVPGDCGDEYRKPPFLTASGDLSDHLDSIPPAFEATRDQDGRQRVFSGTSWETLAGYSRAVRDGNRILVSGTTATHGDRLIGGDDPAAQAHFVIDKIEAAIRSLGGRLEDVVRTRVFVADIADWEPVARAHGDRFLHIQPANTLVEAQLVGEDYRVEIEAEAVVRDPGQ